MSTRAIVKIQSDDEFHLIDRSHDGFPDVVLKDIEQVITMAEGRWSEPELGCMVALFISYGFDYNNTRLPYYEPISDYPGDESYTYWMKYDREDKEWKYGKD